MCNLLLIISNSLVQSSIKTSTGIYCTGQQQRLLSMCSLHGGQIMESESCLVAAAALHTGACWAALAFLQHKHNNNDNYKYVNDNNDNNNSSSSSNNNNYNNNQSNDDNRNMTIKVIRTKQQVKGELGQQASGVCFSLDTCCVGTQ